MSVAEHVSQTGRHPKPKPPRRLGYVIILDSDSGDEDARSLASSARWQLFFLSVLSVLFVQSVLSVLSVQSVLSVPAV